MPTYLKYDRFSSAHGMDYSSEQRMNDLISESVAIIREFTSVSGRNIIAFSGGKDSIVTAHLCRQHGILKSITEQSFMFTRSLSQTKAIGKSLGLDMAFESGLSWEWLEDNQAFCAPPMHLQSKLYAMRQQKTVKRMAKVNGFTGVAYGRRLQENTVKASIYQTADGQFQCHPLRTWKTQDIWTYIHSNKLSFPDLYQHEIGKKEGFTHFLLPPEHFDGCVWKAIYNYEPAVVQRMATFHAPARRYLETIT
jgi:3'-phosphoadenosine 5'-phosphosulfate sulfotransferase (PAPS reductase)/FAD synthetase